jgi:hypothetical protein
MPLAPASLRPARGLLVALTEKAQKPRRSRKQVFGIRAASLTSEFSKKPRRAFVDVSTKLDWLAMETDHHATKIGRIITTGDAGARWGELFALRAGVWTRVSAS